MDATKRKKGDERVGTFLFLGGFLGVTIGWLLWPLLLVAITTCYLLLWLRGRSRVRWLFLAWTMIVASYGIWLLREEGSIPYVSSLYLRQQYELILSGWHYFLAGATAPVGEVLWAHVTQRPVAAVSFAFGPLLGIILSIGSGASPESSRRDSSPDSLPLKGEGRGTKNANGEVSQEATIPVLRWMTGEDFAEMDDEQIVQLWGYGVQVGAVTGWIGVPKVGKSEAYCQLLGAMILGLPMFLGVAVYATSVVVMAEETAQVYRDKALVAGGWLERSLLRGPHWFRPWKLRYRRLRRSLERWWTIRNGGVVRDIHVVCGKNVKAPKGIDNLPLFTELARQRAEAVGAKVIVFDSLNFWVPSAITNDTVSKQAATLFGELAAQGYAVILIHHMNKKGEMAGPDSLYSQLDFRVDCLVPGDADPRTTDVRQLLWSGRFPRDYPSELRTLIYRMQSDGKLIEAGNPTPQYAPPAREEVERCKVETPPDTSYGTADTGSPWPDVGCGLVYQALTKAPMEWRTADACVTVVAADGEMHSAGRIKQHLNHLADAGHLERDKLKGVRGAPVQYRVRETP